MKLAIALLEIPVLGWTCSRTEEDEILRHVPTLVDVSGVGFLSDLLPLLLPISRHCGFRCLLGCLTLWRCCGGLGSGGGRGFASSESRFVMFRLFNRNPSN